MAAAVAGPQAVLTPERLSDEHRLIGRTTPDFVRNEILPAVDRLEKKDWPLACTLVAERIRNCQEEGCVNLLMPKACSSYREPALRLTSTRATRFTRLQANSRA